MKPKASKQPKPSKPTTRLKDIKPKKNPVGAANQGWGRWEVNLGKVLSAPGE